MTSANLPATLLMIRPGAFGFNPETAESNVFQKKTNLPSDKLQKKALAEFEKMVVQIKNAGVEVFVFEDLNKETPDSIFPNNWVSFHDDGTVVLYPMMSPTRRKERRMDILESLRKNFKISRIIDLTMHEEEARFLEGTGSIVFDHKNKIAFAAHSQRTNLQLFNELCSVLGYQPISFKSNDKNEIPIYHTNVMMALADEFVIICLQSIADEKEKTKVVSALKASGREIIDISFDQMNNFAGNAFFVKNSQNQPFLIISQRAFCSLNQNQTEKIATSCKSILPAVETIENTGGGSVRCMVSEINLPRLIK